MKREIKNLNESRLEKIKNVKEFAKELSIILMSELSLVVEIKS
jgi:hypothetical protein